MVVDWIEMPFSSAVMVNPQVELAQGAEYPFLDMQAIAPGSRCTYASGQRIYKGGGSRFAAGDTLLARITPCLENGKISRFCSHQGSLAHGSTEFIVIRGREGITDTDYAYYLTKWDGVTRYAISQMTGTSGRQRVPVGSLDYLTVPIPPLPVQRAIAAILGALDDKIELNNRMNQTLEAIAQALFKSWFVDFEPFRHQGMEDSPLGPIPVGWSVAKLCETCDITMGQSPPGNSYNEIGDGVPFFQGIKDFGFRFPNHRVYCTKPTRFADVGDVLLSVRAPVGSLNMASEHCAIGRGLAALRFKGRKKGYLYYLMRATQDKWNNFDSEGTVFGCIRKIDIYNFELITPPLSVTDRFGDLIEPFNDRIFNNEVESSNLAAIRDMLLPKLLSGEVRVKDIDKSLFAETEITEKDTEAIYTIGHSNHSIQSFINLLKRNNITAIADVRSSPFSKYHSQFIQATFAKALKKEGIAYVFLGKELGARPDDPTCYIDGSVDFEKLAEKPLFKHGIERLLNGKENYRIALLCAEKEPLDCHRTILVSRHLSKMGLPVKHILADGSIEEHKDTEHRLIKVCRLEPTLFNTASTDSERIQEAYSKRAREIAYMRDSEEEEYEHAR